jgi:alpha-galactosidase
MMATGGRLPVESRSQQVINLGIPECYDYVRDAISAILDEYSIQYIKWDHNRDLIDAGTQPAGRPGVHEQTLAVYRLLDELKAAHPGLEIESCSSGGARVDLGVLERTDRVWVSDCIDPLERQEMHRWTSQLIPPELLGSHIASGRSHTTGRRHDLDFRASTAIFGHLGIEWNIASASAEELDELAAWIRLFKEHRGLLFSGEIIRLDFPDETLTAGGVVAADQRSALYYLVATGRSEVVSLGRIQLPGLAADQRYRVTPLMLDFPPSGLRPPPWWGVRPAAANEYEHQHSGFPARLVVDPLTLGVELSGAVLAEAGLMAAQVDPEHAVIYLAEAVD